MHVAPELGKNRCLRYLSSKELTEILLKAKSLPDHSHLFPLNMLPGGLSSHMASYVLLINHLSLLCLSGHIHSPFRIDFLFFKLPGDTMNCKNANVGKAQNLVLGT